ncbi:MAG: hypothetical protein ACYC2G_10525 [Gemmatimonadaceae bacterium]
MRSSSSIIIALCAAALVIAGCAPRARPLVGAPAPAVLPSAELHGHTRLVFRWEYSDGSLVGRGEGVARMAGPDSLRLDFFLDGGAGGGTAFLIGDSLSAPGGDLVRRLLPTPALLWAAVGRLAVPPVNDTTARVDGEALRADLGADPVFRVTFLDGRLSRLERIEDGRLQEWVSRPDSTTIEYRHEAARRQLSLKITRDDAVEAFDADVWRR